MKGYPPGTVCVITWCSEEPAIIGRQVECLEGPILPHNPKCPDPRCGRRGLPSQMIRSIGWSDAVGVMEGDFPVSWLRPLEDPDADPVETEQREEQPA